MNDDFSPHWHLYPHKISTVVVRNKFVSVLQEKKKTTTPEAESAGWIRSVLSNTQTICILSSLLCMQGFILTQTVAYVYAAPKYNNHKKKTKQNKPRNMHFN